MAFSKTIKGVERLIEALPEEYHYWNKFGIIMKFDYEQYYDYVEEMYFANVYMIVTDSDEKYKIGITLKKVYGNIKYTLNTYGLSGFDISDMKSFGYESTARYHIFDFENDAFNIWCNDLEVKLL